MDLSLLILRDVAAEPPPYHDNSQLVKVIQAETWLQGHMAEQPSVSHVAGAVGLSASQLARLFRSVRKKRPKQVFDRLRLEKAMHLMTHSHAKLDNVAAECGFSGASNFCRAFKAVVGNSPTMWRQEAYIQYKRPREQDAADHTRHGRRYRRV